MRSYETAAIRPRKEQDPLRTSTHTRQVLFFSVCLSQVNQLKVDPPSSTISRGGSLPPLPLIGQGDDGPCSPVVSPQKRTSCSRRSQDKRSVRGLCKPPTSCCVARKRSVVCKPRSLPSSFLPLSLSSRQQVSALSGKQNE